MHLAGVDMVTGTPVLDIKPYIPQYDSPQPQHTSAQVRLLWTLVAVLNPFALIAHIVYVMTILFSHGHVPIIDNGNFLAMCSNGFLEVYPED